MATRTKPGDLTAKQRQDAAASAEEERNRRADEISLITATKMEKLENSVLDTSGREISEQEAKTVVLDASNSQHEIIRVSADVSFILGSERFSFVAGQKYKVPRHVADHLEEVGYLWRMS